MKYLALLPLLFPLTVLAHEEAPPVCEATPETPPPVVTMPPSSPTVPVPPTAPSNSVPVVPTGGSGQIYCSGPTAPGWHVDLPNGGCKPTQNPPNLLKPIQPVVTPPMKTIYLRDMPYTGAPDSAGLTYEQLATAAFLLIVGGALVISRLYIK